MSTRLLFLDIDGVMHSVDRVQATYTSTGIEYSGERLFEHLPSFGRILDQCPEVSVINSSSWRHAHSLQELQGFFGDWGHRVIGTTTSIDASGSLPANRFQECRVMAEQLGVSDWVMVDDQPRIVWGAQIPNPDLARRVIWCDPVLGGRGRWLQARS
ncbi:MAG: HAD domain-containing protein [Betaproteobacteria bacterium]|nr:HAD domain-containing protein [Betaproteobacteria bacterium]